MRNLGPNSELRRLVLRYFKDQGGVIGYKDWNWFDIETAGRLDPLLQSEWVGEGYIQTNPEKGCYKLTEAGQEELRRLTTVKFHDPLDQNRDFRQPQEWRRGRISLSYAEYLNGENLPERSTTFFQNLCLEGSWFGETNYLYDSNINKNSVYASEEEALMAGG